MDRFGKITAVRDEGTIWQIFYRTDDGTCHVVSIDHRCFAHLYEGETCRSFYRDYAFGAGRRQVESALTGREIHIGDGKDEGQVWFE